MSDRGKSCSWVRDILPLYISGEVSGETRQMIEEHLTDCSDCRSIYAGGSQEAEKVRYRKIARKIKHRRIRIICLVSLAIVLLLVLYTSMFQRVLISGECMSPAVSDEQYYWLNKVSYRLGQPQAGDVVVYRDGDLYYAARVDEASSDKDEYQISRDNRTDSGSRQIIHKESIVGKVMGVEKNE